MNRGVLTRKVTSLLIWAATLVLTVISLFPVVWMILTSFKTKAESFQIPPAWLFSPSLDNYRTVMSGGDSVAILPRPLTFYLTNSLVVGVITTIISVSIGALASYSITRLTFPGRGALSVLIVGSRVLPPIATLMPIFLMFRNLGLIDTRLGLILIYSSLNAPFAAWMLRGFFASIPRELEEAAQVDGSTRLGVLFKIVVPLVLPGLAATSIFSFTLAWNDLPFALFLTSTEAVTLPVVATFTRTEVGTLWGPMAALGTVMIIPIWVFTLISQRWLVEGLTSGSVKG
jgi:multiple sugar transport system permease protein